MTSLRLGSVTSLRPPEHPTKEPSFPGVTTAQLAMYVGLASLSVLFAASLVAFFITRSQAEHWRPTELPQLPYGLWLSTALLIALSLVMRRAERCLARNAYDSLTAHLTFVLVLSLFFLLAQVQNWREVAALTLEAQAKTLYMYTFYMLTALHAVHVLFGLGPLVFVIRRSRLRYYSSSRNEGVRLMRQYWDFLLVVWVLLLGTLWFS